MRSIQKRTEPRSLTEHRSSPFATYDNYKDKDGLRKALVNEQRGLCCYCLGRIRPDRSAMKIEHWHAQSQHPDEQLDYRNLLAACLGKTRELVEHCDTMRADEPLAKNPANPLHRVEDLIVFRGDGTIYSHDTAFNRELDEILNLNTPYLKNRRKEMLRAFLDRIGREGAREQQLRKELGDYSGESHSRNLEPYCMIVVAWLRKRLARG
jgi:uncharacterized protein (TIGR02646 family)